MITHSKKFVLLCLCLFILGIFTSACGGGGKSTPPNYPFIPIPTPSPTVSPTPEPTPTPTPEKYDIELSQTEFTVNVGATDNITVTLNGEDITQTATYTVDQEAIASVEGGLITGLSAGFATVTVHAENAIEDKTFTVNVIDQSLPTLEVEPSEVNLIIEETANVKVTLEGEDVTEQVKYDVDEKSIATAEKGVVTAKYTGGTAIITVSHTGANSATFKVNVTDDSEEVRLDGNVLVQLGYNRDENNNIYKDGNIVTNLEIPAIYFYEGKKYKIISIERGGNVFSNCTSLTNVTIPESVRSIEKQAFQNCSELENITISDSVIRIGENAFYECTSLKNVIIGNSVTSIEYQAFLECSKLENVIIGNSVVSIGSSAFASCTSLTNVTIPESVRSIGTSAFHSCYELENVTIGDDVLCIFPTAFMDCNKLTELTTKNGETITIKNGAYTKNNVTFIYVKQYNSSNVTGKIEIPNGVTEIPVSAFSGSSLTEITIPDSVTSIGTSAFSMCSDLEKVNFGKKPSLTTIEFRAFSGCTNSALSIDIPDGVTSIGDYAFYNVNNINISEAQKSLDDYPWGAKKVNGVPVEQ